MRKRQLGHSHLFVSEIGLGAMSLGTNETEALAIIDYALGLGINFVDTADLYDKGLNETFVGKAIKNKRQDVILSTKVGNRWNSKEQGWYWDASKKYIKEAVKGSLHRLGTDYIDLYQLHGGTIEDNIPETIEAFNELKEEGVIRYYGISSIRPNVIRAYVGQSDIVSVMMQYSLLDRRPESLFPLLAENNISVITRGTLGKGILTNKKKLPEQGYLSYSHKELQDLLHKLEGEKPLEVTAIQFSLHQQVVASTILGASRKEQVESNVIALAAQAITDEEYAYLQAITKEKNYTQHN